MKVKAILFAVFLLAGTVNVFATTGKKANNLSKPKLSVSKLLFASCKVAVTVGGTTYTATTNCGTCSQTVACDACYAALRQYMK